MAARRAPRIEKAVKAMRDHMWEEKAGTFLAVNRDSLEKIPVATIGSWIPLAAGVPTPAMARRMAEVLASPAWMTPLPAADRGSNRQAVEIQRLLARRRLAIDQLPDRQRPRRLWTQRPCRRHRRQDHRQRHQERHQRTLRLDFGQAAGSQGLLHELHAGYDDAGRAYEETQVDAAR